LTKGRVFKCGRLQIWEFCGEDDAPCASEISLGRRTEGGWTVAARTLPPKMRMRFGQE